jgi:hypothetical protein
VTSVDLICLANSKKLGGWCIAGWRADGGGWIRPVANTGHGELYPGIMKLPDGSQPRTLDLLRIPLKEPRPLKSQPENWLVSAEPWTLLARPAPESMIEELDVTLMRGPELLGSKYDSVPESFFDKHPNAPSLALVVPTGLRWRVTKDFSDKRQLRAGFSFGNAEYDLGVTDVEYEKQTRRLDFGTHPFTPTSILFPGVSRIRLTISLSRPFNGSCYKLVAGIIATESFLELNL